MGNLLPIPGAGLAYERTGDGPALALLHPLGADRSVWAPVIPLIAAQRDVIAVDLPGFGESPRLRQGLVPHPRELAAAVVGLLAELGLDGGRAHLAGNSLGGWGGARGSARRPRRERHRDRPRRPVGRPA